MTASHTYDGDDLADIRRGQVSTTQIAEMMAVGTGRVVVNDDAGTVVITGQKDYAIDESACSDPITFRGFVNTRTIGRAVQTAGTSRDIEIALEDLNAMGQFRGIVGDTGNREPETVADRAAWLMASPFVDGLFIDNGRCDFPADKGMDRAVYINQFPADVLADMLQAAEGYNAYIRDFGDGPELVFRDDNASTADSSTLRISNVIADKDATTFYPSRDFKLTRSPERVVSKIGFLHGGGDVIEERASTAAAFNGERFAVVSNSNVKTDSTASRYARDFLRQHSIEEDVLTGSILVPASQVNLLNHGDRIECKFEDMTPEGYGDFSWFRVLECTKRPLLKPAGKYWLDLRLSPQEAGGLGTGFIQSADNRVGEGGGLLSLTNPVTIGHVLIFAIVDRGVSSPVAPNTDPAQPRFGEDAWTRFNGATVTETHATENDGVAMYWKVADSTEQVGWVAASNAHIAVYELEGFDPASATVIDVTEGVGDPYTLGTLGTVATDEFAVMAIAVGNLPDSGSWPWGGPGAPPSGGYPWNTSSPNPGISAGWTIDRSQWAYDNSSSGYFIPIHPWGTIAHAMGTGATLDATISPGQTNHGFGGLAVKIPPV